MKRFLTLLLFLLSCADTPAQAVIVIEAAATLQSDIEEVRLYISSVDENGTAFWLNEQGMPVEFGVDDSGNVVGAKLEVTIPRSWPLQHVLTPIGGDATRRFQIIAEGVTVDREIVARRALRGGYLDAQRVDYTLIFNNDTCVRNTECTLPEFCAVTSTGDPGCEPPAYMPPSSGADAGI